MTKNLFRRFIKYAVYILIVFISFIIQTTPGLLELCGMKPMLVLPVCLCIAIFEGEYAGGLVGAFGGLLCDFAADTVFGFNGLLFLIFSVALGLAFIYLVRVTFSNALLLVLAAVFIRALLEYFFVYVIWGYEGLPLLFYTYTAPDAVYSAAFVALGYPVVRFVHNLFEALDEKEVEL